MGIDHRGHRGFRESLRELAARSGRLVEFSVAWARRLKRLKPETVRKLQQGLREQTRQVGGQLGEGVEFRTYESFTPGRGHTVTKVLKEKTLKEKTRAERLSSNPYRGGVDEILNRTKREWRDIAESPAGEHAALPVGWHKAGYVQDRMVEVDARRRAGRRHTEPKESFVKKINPFAPTTQTDKGLAHRMPLGASDSSLLTQVYTGQEGKYYENLRGRTKVTAHNIMLDPRRGKRKLVLTDPLGQVSFAARGGRLVEFNTFGATRQLLRGLKSSGVSVARNAGETSFYSGSRNLINIPRGQAGVAEGVGRRNALFHEAGHAKVNASGGSDNFHIEAHKADQAGASLADRMKIGSHGNEMRRQERLANQTAQADMERMGVPKENITSFRKDMAGSLNTYRAGHYTTTSPKATIPASSPKATTAQATAAAPTASQPPQPPQAPQTPQTPQAPQTQPTSPFRKKPWLAGGVAAAGAVGVGGYMATRKPEHKDFMNIKTRIKELAAKARLVELARVQSVAGQILNINPVPRKVADPILRSLRRKLEKGGDRQAVRAAFLGPKGPRMRRAGRAYDDAMLANTPAFDGGVRAGETDLWKPRLVDVNGNKSLLHYRVARSEDALTQPFHALHGSGRSHIDTPEGAMRSHVSSPGAAISTSTQKAKAMRFISAQGRQPVEGVYATPLDELIKNQREKIKGAMVNRRYPSEREITQTHGNNLIKVRKYQRGLDEDDPFGQPTFARQRSR